MEALKPYYYFTAIKLGGKNLSSKLGGNVTWEVNQGRSKMRFALAVDEPVSVHAQI